MPNPPSGMKITKNGVTYKSNIDRTKYTIRELSRAALRDVGKYVVRQTRTLSLARPHMGHYLSAVEDENRALGLIDEEEMQPDGSE